MFRTVPLSSSGVFHCTHSNCLKHVEFYSKNKFDKSVHLVGFIIRMYHNAQSPERQILLYGCYNKIQHILQLLIFTE